MGNHDPLFTHGVGGTIRPDFSVFSRPGSRVRWRVAPCHDLLSEVNRQFRRIACKAASENRVQHQDDERLKQFEVKTKRQSSRNIRYDPLSPSNC